MTTLQAKFQFPNFKSILGKFMTSTWHDVKPCIDYHSYDTVCYKRVMSIIGKKNIGHNHVLLLLLLVWCLLPMGMMSSLFVWVDAVGFSRVLTPDPWGRKSQVTTFKWVARVNQPAPISVFFRNLAINPNMKYKSFLTNLLFSYPHIENQI